MKKQDYVIQVEGGIGHHLNMSLVFRKLKQKKSTGKLIVFAPWTDVLDNMQDNDIDELYSEADHHVFNNIYKRFGGNIHYSNPTIYRERLQCKSDKHIKEILCDMF